MPIAGLVFAVSNCKFLLGMDANAQALVEFCQIPEEMLDELCNAMPWFMAPNACWGELCTIWEGGDTGGDTGGGGGDAGTTAPSATPVCTIMSGSLPVGLLAPDDACCSTLDTGAGAVLQGGNLADLASDDSCGTDACGQAHTYAFTAAEGAAAVPAGTTAAWTAVCDAHNNPAPAWLQTFTDCAEGEDSTFVASSFSAEVQCAMGALIGPDTRDTLEDGT